MAFNPFVSFRKYQKFWMATILLVCMVTFVLCTGVGGDLSDRLLRLFGGHRGKVWAKLDGRSIYQDDFDKLKTQRSMINDFMHEANKIVLGRVDQYKKDDSVKVDAAHRKVMLARLSLVEADLNARKSRKNYFETGTKLDELVDFMIWKKLADKLDIQLVDDTIKFMFEKEVVARVPLGEQTAIPLFGGLDSRHIQFELRHKYPYINDQAIIKALRDEFRVRLAQEAYLQALSAQSANYRSATYLKFRSLGTETRIPLTPDQMWDMYKDKRTQYDVALVPVRVDHFLDKIERPKEDELEAFFKKYQRVAFDPARPTPGFEIPTKVKVEYVMADPNSPHYKQRAQLASEFIRTPPAAWSPFFPHLNAIAEFGFGPLAFDAYLERDYGFLKKGTRGAKYQMAPLTEPALPSLLSYLGKPTPTLVASMAGLGAGLEPGSAIQLTTIGHLYPKHQKQIQELLVDENKARARMMATLIGLGYVSPFTPLKAWEQAGRQEQYLPLGAVAQELKELRERRLAGEWVNANMIKVKEKLDELPAGKGSAIRRHLDPLIRKYGLIHRATSDFQDRFTIAKAPELAELNKAFEKERENINRMLGRQDELKLTEGDLYKLFFPGESFAAGTYVPRPWPPVLEIKSDKPNTPPKTVSRFDEAEKPFLFWKTEEKSSRPAENLEEVRDQVLTAWKMEKAKEKFALARAKEIAEKLSKAARGDLMATLREEAKKLGVEPVYLDRLAVLHPHEGLGRSYGNYPLPKDIFKDTFPREDMIKQLLAVTTMEKPLQIDYKALDDPNKKLQETYKKTPEGMGKKIQILTNQPQNTFYVAAVVAPPVVKMEDFIRAYKDANREQFSDALIETFQQDAAKEFRQAFVSGQRAAMDYRPEFTEEDRRNFDAGGGN